MIEILKIPYQLFLKIPRNIRNFIGVLFIVSIFSFCVLITYTNKGYIRDIVKQDEKLRRDPSDIKVTDMVFLDDVCQGWRFTYTAPLQLTASELTWVKGTCADIHQWLIDHEK